ncbi:MAG: hypothetical protein ACFFCI_09340 [Promethearchaeota archaeon]
MVEIEQAEERLCENCGDDGTIAMFHVMFKDDEEVFTCAQCTSEYFTECPDEIESVEAI